MLVAHIIEIVVPIFAIVFIGAVYAHFRAPSMEVVNRVNIDVFVPALVFSAMSKQSFALSAYGLLSLGAICIILGSGLLGWLAANLFSIIPKTLVPPTMFRNAGNMGLPLIVLAFGNDALPAALVLFLIGNLAHFGIGTYLLDHKARWWNVFRQPVIISAVAALAVGHFGLHLPQPIALPLEMMGQIAIPLMLFSLGVRLLSADIREWRIGLMGALMTPLTGIAIAFMFVFAVDLPRIQAGALLLFGALPPAVLNFLFAERYQQEPDKVASIVMLGNSLAIITVSLVLAYVLPRFG